MKFVIIVVLFSVLIGFGYHTYYDLTRPLPKPTLDTNKYWGKGDGANYKPDTSINKFRLKVDPEIIEDLRQQLNRTLKLTEPLEGTLFEYGFNTDALKQLIDYWRDKYLPKWTTREAFLNGLPQYTTEIQGLRIHYIHDKPSDEALKTKKVFPLLLLHGWPGSVREFYTLSNILTTASEINDYVFEVIAPSLVGYGWSDPAAKPGFNAAHMAIVMRNLMLRLGHEKFFVQGGDWGSIIGSNIATLFPENVIGYHSNMCVLHSPLSIMKGFYANMFPDRIIPSSFLHAHHFPLSEKLEFLLVESGYFHIQATKPDTIGTALLANPIGLLTYIVEKFQTAAGPGYKDEFHALAQVYSLEAVLDNIMIYYLTNTATTAARFYAENTSKEYLSLQLDRVQSPVPMACARFRWDLPSATDWQLLDKFPNMVASKYFHQGGHFAALEKPVLLYTDFTEFLTRMEL